MVELNRLIAPQHGCDQYNKIWWYVRLFCLSECPVRKTVKQSLLAYAIATAIVCYAARGVSWREVVSAGSHATFWIFVIASLGGFVCWFIGEAVLYSRLFTYFHGSTEALELIPTMAAVSFLQIVNSYVAAGAFVLFLHVRKRVPWIMGGCTLMFQGYVDAMLLATLSLFAIALVPSSPIRLGFEYAAAVLGIGCVIASFWLLWGGLLPKGTWLRWLYEQPAMSSFRMARPSHYINLFAIRFLIVLGAGLSLHGQFVSFHIRIPLVQTLALTPFIAAIGNAPISPAGIGTTQLILTLAFARFASKDSLFALSLAVTAFNLLVRIPMGLAIGGPLMEEAVEVKSEFATNHRVG